MENKIVLTADGSHSLYVAELDEHYHSHHGAIQEAKHVFIKHGLEYLTEKKEINVLEVGFGTGLNAFLTLLYSIKNDVSINYTGIELYPVNAEVVNELNYLKQLNETNNQDLFMKMHQTPWEESNDIHENFRLTKLKQSLFDTQFQECSFDVVFYDAFGPRAQKEMWDKEIFINTYSWLNKGGCLVTYCAMGQLKRDLKASGFLVESLPGPPGKREMTRATKK